MKALFLAAVLLAGCSVPATRAAAPAPATAAATAPSPSPSVSVLGVKLAQPTPKPKPKPVVRASHTPRPVIAHPKPKPGGCVVGQPCSLSHVTWTKTIGCTKTWLANQRRTNPLAECPPGWPYLG